MKKKRVASLCWDFSDTTESRWFEGAEPTSALSLRAAVVLHIANNDANKAVKLN